MGKARFICLWIKIHCKYWGCKRLLSRNFSFSGADTVKVDESLFQDLEDLDLDDDEDFDPNNLSDDEST